MASIFSSFTQRELGLVTDTTYWKTIRDSDYLVRRLKKRSVLDGHHGCVNTVAWNTTGSHLISGSDDCHLNFYDTSTGLLRSSVHSSHQSNIFSAKFLPCPSNCKAVSCAGIGSVEYSELTPAGDYIGHSFKCQTSITYQVATTPFDCNLFLTCEERGCVRMFDLRAGNSCICAGCQKHVLYSFQDAVTSMAVHPLSPFYLALGLGDGSVRLLDQRMLGEVGCLLASDDSMELTRKSMCRRYRPSSLVNRPYKVTSVQFNPTGSELLSSYSEDYVYLFSSGVFGCGGGSAQIAKPVYLSQCERYQCKRRRVDSVRSKPVSSADVSNSSGGLPASNEIPPPMKRLRLRGDWSDTGPGARPGDQSSAEGNTLMNRMSRMFTQWIDMSLSPSENSGSSQNPGNRRREGEEGGREGHEGERGTSERDSPLATPSSSENSFHLFSDSENDHDNNSIPNSRTETPASSLTNGLGSCSIDIVTDTGTNSHSDTGTNSHSDTGTNSHSDSPQGNGKSKVQTPDSGAVKSDRNTGELRKMLLEPVENSHTNSSMSTLPGNSSVKQKAPESRVQECFDDSPKMESDENSLSESVKKETFLNEGDESQIQPTHNSASLLNSDASVVVECRTTKSAVPSIRIIDGDATDSDDLRSCDEHQESCDRSHDGCHMTKDDSKLLEEEEEEVSTEDSYSSFEQPFMVYKGHRNARTMIKQANFWGENWVMSGSDCGRVFMWDKWTGEITNLLMADSHVVNCVQPHPEAYILATSGIDYNVKLWEPTAEQPCSLHNLDEIIQRNEVMLQESRNTITVPSTFVLRILAYLNRRRRLRRDAEQPPEDESDSD